MGSTRLPGKVLKEVCGQTLLEHQMARMRRARTLAEVVVATSTAPADDAIADLTERRAFALYRGSESDVLSRYAEAAAAFDADPVVRMTMDCPLIDPDVVDLVVQHYLWGSFDLVANNFEPTFPHGLDLEVISRAALETAHAEAAQPYEREHVSPFLRHHPERFRLGNVRSPRDLHAHRWTVDYPEDFAFVRAVYEALYPQDPAFGTEAVLRFLDAHPEVRAFNAARSMAS
jgi:spore coat polysaccharide biosynthesis protein SpsF